MLTRVMIMWGYAVAQAVSCQVPIMVTQLWSQVRPCGICGGQSGAGAGCLEVFQFPLPIHILPAAPHLLIIFSLVLYSLNTDSIFGGKRRNKVNWMWRLVARSCEHDNKPVEFHKNWRISSQAVRCQVLKKDSTLKS
jgi:hypothetical protein